MKSILTFLISVLFSNVTFGQVTGMYMHTISTSTTYEITTNGGSLMIFAEVLPVNPIGSNFSWSVIPITTNVSNFTSNNYSANITAYTNGTVWVKAVYIPNPTIKDSVLVTISNQFPVTGVSVGTQGGVPPIINTNNGQLQMEATILPSNAVNHSVTWDLIPVTGYATMVTTTGVINAVTNGTVWAKAISNADPTIKDSLLVTITNQIVPITSINVTTQGSVPSTITSNAGTLQMSTTILPSTANQAVIWSVVPGTGTAKISTSGLVTAQTNGTVWAKAISLQDVSFKDSLLISITNQGVGIPKVKNQNKFKVFPNPINNQVTISFESGFITNKLIRYSIVDINGRIISEGNIESEKTNINVSKWSAGNYILKIEGENIKGIQSIIKL